MRITTQCRLACAAVCAVMIAAVPADAVSAPAGQHASGLPSAGSARLTVGAAPEPRAGRVRGVLTDASGGAALLGGTLPRLLPIEPDEYDYCKNPDSGAYPDNTEDAISISVAGYSDESKLGDAAAVGVPVPAVAAGNPPDEGLLAGGASTSEITASGGKEFQCDLITTQLDYQGLRQFPPLQATFLAFGFMPVTATAYLTQVGPDPLTAVVVTKVDDACVSACSPGELGPSVPEEPIEIVATAKVELRLADVTVNGVPLNVGNDCQTSRPLESTQSPVPGESFPGELALYGGAGETGDPEPEWSGYLYGGAVAGAATIPPFTGCTGPGGENLDPLLTSTVSGPDNYIQVNTSAACYNDNPPECASSADGATANTPSITPYWTVENGDDYTGDMTSDSLVINDTRTVIKPSVIACAGSSLTGSIPDAAGPPRVGLGTMTLSFSSTCQGQQGLADSTWQVTGQGTATLAPISYVASGGLFHPSQVWMKVTNLALNLSGKEVPGVSGGKCTVDLSGRSAMLYTQPVPGSVVPALQWLPSLSANLQLFVDMSGCTHTSIFGPGFNAGDPIDINGTYDLYQECSEPNPEECQPAAITFTNPSMPAS